jgi:hypothetical protein
MTRQGSPKTSKPFRAKKAAQTRPPRPHVISLRVNDQERQLIEQISRRRRKNVSALVREALAHLLVR